VKVPGEKQFRNGPAFAPHDTLVTELAKAESDLERIEAQRIAAKARIATLRNKLAALAEQLGHSVIVLHKTFAKGDRG
jgi:hypothetical protein